MSRTLTRRLDALETGGQGAGEDPELVARRKEVLASPSALAAALAPPGYIPDAPHLLLIQDAFMMLVTGEETKVNLAMPPRHGKALALDTLIPTPSGWTTMGDLAVGDEVFDETGAVCRVTGVSPVWHDRPAYDVVSDSGAHIVADAEHEWLANLDRRRPDKMYTTRELARSRTKQALIRSAGALKLPEADLPVDPYVLGVWLGDGSSAHATITCHDDDQSHVRGRIEAAGYRTTDRATRYTFGVRGILPGLRAAGVLGDKHVPTAYLRASRDQRLALLQGLIDTDGHVAPDGQVEFCSTSRALADAVQELVRTLGTKASFITGDATLDGQVIGPKYRVMFYMAEAASLPRKAIRCRDGVRTPGHYVTATKRGATATRCIEVDSASHLFLAGEAMVPTHNSEFLRWCLLWHLATFPDEGIMIVSSAGELALKHGRWLRRMIERHGELLGITLSPDSKAANRFDLDGRAGGAVITTPGGGGTGFTARTILVDDPVKSRRHANSKADMAALEDWWRDVVVSRRMGQWGGALLMHTRFAEGDLAGRLLAQDPDAWYVLNVPAVAMSDEEWAKLGKDPVPDALGRKPGEALWPEVYPLEILAEKRRDSGEATWWALYQGQPRQPEGALLTPQEIVDATVAQVPDGGRAVVAVDPAGEGDDEVGIVTGVKAPDGIVYLVADRSGSMGSATWPQAVCRAVLESGAGSVVAEANGVGQAAPRLIRLAWEQGQREGWIPAGKLVPDILHKGTSESKWARAEPVAALIRNGGVKFGPGMGRCAHEFLTWTPDSPESPGRLDAAVWAVTVLNPLKGVSRIGNPARPQQPRPLAAVPSPPKEEGQSPRPAVPRVSPWSRRIRG